MKKAVQAILILGLLGPLAIQPAVSQAKEKQLQNNVSVNVFNFIISTFSVEYERFLFYSQKLGIYGTARYGSFEISDVDISWPGVSAGVRFYPNGHAPAGLFLAGLLYWNQMKVDFQLGGLSEEVTASFIGPMVGLGYRWNMDGFTVAPAFQVGSLSGEAKSAVTNQKLNYGGGAFMLGLNVGYAF